MLRQDKKAIMKRLNTLDSQLFELYWTKGKISLSVRNQLRELLKELRKDFEVLFTAAQRVLHRPSKKTLRKEFAQLTNIMQCMEYNFQVLAA